LAERVESGVSKVEEMLFLNLLLSTFNLLLPSRLDVAYGAGF
jgi:hypothetical protein